MLCLRLKALLCVVFSISFVTTAWGGYTDIYVIGDSLSDQGNLFNATQRTTGNGVPASDHYYQGRFSNGEVYAGVLAQRLGLRLTASSAGGNNFAFGGARVEYHVAQDDATKPFPVSLLRQGGVFPKDAFPWSINGQRKAFLDRDVKNADALYVVFTGSNDMADLISMVFLHAVQPTFPAVDPASIIAKVISNIDATIAEVVSAGARDVIVSNMPNFGLVPRILEAGPAAAVLATGLSQQYNAAFAEMLAKWTGRVNIVPVDLYALLSDVAAQPAAFGFSNASTPCYSGFVEPAGPNDSVCTTPDSYVFWDREHPTAAFHAFLARRLHGAIMLDVLDDLGVRLRNVAAAPGVVAGLANRLNGIRQKLTDANAVNDGSVVARLEAFSMAVNVQRSKGQLTEADALVLTERADKVTFLLSKMR